MTTPARLSKPSSGAIAAGATHGQGVKAAEQHRLAQAVLAAILTRDILNIWFTLDVSGIKTSWAAIRAAVVALIRSGMAESLLAGTRFYAESRDLAGILGEAPNLIPALAPEELIIRTIESTGPGQLLHDIKAGQPMIRAMEHAGVKLAGASARLVQQAGREGVLQLVENDPKAIAWARITSGQPCAFCAMLASRGAVYKTEQSAGFLAHNHCACTAMPVFRREDATSPAAQALYDAWRQATKGLSGQEAFRAWRRYWDGLDNGLDSLNPAA